MLIPRAHKDDYGIQDEVNNAKAPPVDRKAPALAVGEALVDWEIPALANREVSADWYVLADQNAPRLTYRDATALADRDALALTNRDAPVSTNKDAPTLADGDAPLPANKDILALALEDGDAPALIPKNRDAPTPVDGNTPSPADQDALVVIDWDKLIATVTADAFAKIFYLVFHFFDFVSFLLIHSNSKLSKSGFCLSSEMKTCLSSPINCLFSSLVSPFRSLKNWKVPVSK